MNRLLRFLIADVPALAAVGAAVCALLKLTGAW